LGDLHRLALVAVAGEDDLVVGRVVGATPQIDVAGAAGRLGGKVLPARVDRVVGRHRLGDGGTAAGDVVGLHRHVVPLRLEGGVLFNEGQDAVGVRPGGKTVALGRAAEAPGPGGGPAGPEGLDDDGAGGGRGVAGRRPDLRPAGGARLIAVVGEVVVGAVVVLQGQADLLEVVGRGGPVGGLADLLHGRQEQGDEHADDGDDHQQLDQGKPAP